MIRVLDMAGELEDYPDYDRLGSTPAGVLTMSRDEKHGVLIAAGQWAYAEIDVDAAEPEATQEQEGEDG